MTQAQKLLEHLEIHGKITTKEIIDELWILAPQKVIETLRHKGYDIRTVDVKGQKYSEYVYHPGAQTKLAL
jgi:hypothetical protein